MNDRFTDNCVGAANHKEFLLFVIYSVLADGLGAIWYYFWLQNIYAADDGEWPERDSYSTGVLVVLCISGIEATILGSSIMLQQIYLVCLNMSRIEMRDFFAWRQAWRDQKQKGGTKLWAWPYHLGYCRNLSSVMGYNPLLWPCPSPAHPDDIHRGTRFELNPKYLNFILARRKSGSTTDID